MHIKRTEEDDDRTIYLIPISQVRRLNVTPRYCELLDGGSLRFSLLSMAPAGPCSVEQGRFWNFEFIQSAPRKDIIDVRLLIEDWGLRKEAESERLVTDQNQIERQFFWSDDGRVEKEKVQLHKTEIEYYHKSNTTTKQKSNTGIMGTKSEGEQLYTFSIDGVISLGAEGRWTDSGR
ncbi:hypothetical protein L2E82_45797 [Cichorium intybus]|uniref:Uncharacterized protein n=1 Tax=Cichorium intybus TaxID=13427 RepID=A0ACB8ZT04_CICIN|nr:hypothetical protein L2E82_45797 [Cichorium intybus]